MGPQHDKPAVAESPSSIWITALVMLACLAGVTALGSIPSLAGVPRGIFWALYALPILICLWSHLHLNRHGRSLFFLLFPISLVAAVMILCLLPDGLFAWTAR
jgi:hypothetical protein